MGYSHRQKLKPTTSEVNLTTSEANPTTSEDATNSSEYNEILMEFSDEVLDILQSRWLTRFVPSVYTIVIFLSLPLNAMAIIILLFKTQVQMPSVVFMLNLAVADIFFITVLPFDIVYRFSGNNWVIGEEMCSFVTAALYSNMYCSILLMTSISVDRFLAVVYPMESLSWRTVTRAWLVCLIIWIVSFSATVPLLISKLTVYIDPLNITTCYDMLDESVMQSFYFPYVTTYISVFFFLPLIITTFCYAATIRSLSSPIIKSRFKKSRSVVLCATVLCEFILCFGPSNVIFLAYYLTFLNPIGTSLYLAYILAVCFSSISCCLDPVIYYFGSSKCKKHVYNLICCGKPGIAPKSSSRMSSQGSSRYTL